MGAVVLPLAFPWTIEVDHELPWHRKSTFNVIIRLFAITVMAEFNLKAFSGIRDVTSLKREAAAVYLPS